MYCHPINLTYHQQRDDYSEASNGDNVQEEFMNPHNASLASKVLHSSSAITKLYTVLKEQILCNSLNICSSQSTVLLMHDMCSFSLLQRTVQSYITNTSSLRCSFNLCQKRSVLLESTKQMTTISAQGSIHIHDYRYNLP